METLNAKYVDKDMNEANFDANAVPNSSNQSDTDLKKLSNALFNNYHSLSNVNLLFIF
jgi:hypothetical protein